ncbi:hypothetical protein [Ostreibacterium oceani]|uniref:Uncharacterized protein n=1 Tax=Ostreibacterium oceani TaxID=2654998 RepID=A0A6N7EZE1_9GAMM|nr:hypothetical protein [Ostreibacterium oceani]MPV86895.1 hypothetical protein [Ostreibacterium oceani]
MAKGKTKQRIKGNNNITIAGDVNAPIHLQLNGQPTLSSNDMISPILGAPYEVKTAALTFAKKHFSIDHLKSLNESQLIIVYDYFLVARDNHTLQQQRNMFTRTISAIKSFLARKKASNPPF